MEKYNVIIIGAGPAGSHLGKILASNGMNVLIVDKRKEIGSPIRCGEALGQTVEKDVKGFKVPDNSKAFFVNGTRVIAPNGKTITVKNYEAQGWILERKIFDKELAKQAVLAGAELRAYTIAKDIIFEGKKPIGLILDEAGEEKRVYADLIVSAEGMEAWISRKIGLSKSYLLNEVGSCYEYEVGPVKHDGVIEIYQGEHIAPGGYIWIFPKSKDTVNIGIGIMAHRLTDKKPKEYLDEWMQKSKRFGNLSVLEKKGGVIAMCKPQKNVVEDHFIVIGTAARQVDAIHGGGISLALRSAQIAGKWIVNIYKQGKEFNKQNLMAYQKEYLDTMYKELLKRSKIKNVIDKLSDKNMNDIFNELGEQDFEKIIKNNMNEIIGKIILKHPELLLSLRGLME